MPLISPYSNRYEITAPGTGKRGPAGPDYDHETAGRLPPPGHHESLEAD
jgi:hypothetical protein